MESAHSGRDHRFWSAISANPSFVPKKKPMTGPDTKNVQTYTSGPLRLVICKRDPVPAKAMPSNESWTLLLPGSPIRVCTGEDIEEGVIPRGSLALLMPGFGHTFKRHHPDTPFGFTALQMDGPFPEPLVSVLQHPPRKWQEASYAVLRSQSLKQLFGIFTQEIANPDGLQLMTRELFLILLGAELTRLCEKEDRARFPYRLSRSTLQVVLDHMESQIGAKNSVPELASMAKCTPDHFIRLFLRVHPRLQAPVQRAAQQVRPGSLRPAVQKVLDDGSARQR